MKKVLLVLALLTFVVSLNAAATVPVANGRIKLVRNSTPRAQVPYTPATGRALVLFVEDGSGYGPATNPDPNWNGMLTTLLGAGNFGWFGPTLNYTDDGPTLDTMMNYQLVIWNTYDQWDNPPLTANDFSNLQNFIIGGGQVWFIGQDAIYGGGTPMLTFLQDFFNLSTVSEDYVSGDSTTNMTGLVEIAGHSTDVTVDYVWNGFYCDDLTPTTSAHQIVNDATWGAYPGIAAQNVTPFETAFWTIDGRTPSSPSEWQAIVTGMLAAFNVFGVEEKPGLIPTDVSMAPMVNPVRGKTMLSYNTIAPGDVSLKVYDAAGNLVQTLVDQNQPAGRKTATWNTQSLSYGVYFVRLEADGKVVSQKAIVVK
jgi:hypothetical protein